MVVDWDESLYLLIAERWLQGGLPYVDIWDHKPAGLYVAFEVALLVFGRSVIAPRLLAAIMVAGSAWLIWRVVSGAVGERGKIFAVVLLYPAYTLTMGGLAANAEHFFIFANVLGLACLVRAYGTAKRAEYLLLCLCGGLAFGVALQFKYVAIFEALYFVGCFLCGELRKRSTRDLVMAAGMIGVWALLPTIMSFAYFAMHGAGSEFLHSNFIANAKHAAAEYDAVQLVTSTRSWALATAPLWLVWIAYVSLTVPARRLEYWRVHLTLVGWVVVGLVEIAAARRFFTHSYLVTMAPLCALAALALRQATGGRGPSGALVLAGLLALFPLYEIVRDAYLPWYREHGGDETAQLASILRRSVKPGDSLHVVDDQPILYFVTNTRPVTRYVFPPHLMTRHFTALAGIGFRKEVTKILRQRPRCVVLRKKGGDRAQEFRARLGASYQSRGATKRAEVLCR